VRYEALTGLFGVTKLAVFVLDKRKKPLMPRFEKRARLFPTRGRAVVHHRHPLTTRLKGRLGGDLGPVRVRIDHGSKTTGIARITDADGNKPASSLARDGRTRLWGKRVCRSRLRPAAAPHPIAHGSAFAKTHALDAACVDEVGTLVGW
jgi:RRXRR protein